MTVQRAGGGSGTVSVRNANADGTARTGTDDTAASGDLRLTVVLSAPSAGASPGSPERASVVIRNIDHPGGGGPGGSGPAPVTLQVIQLTTKKRATGAIVLIFSGPIDPGSAGASRITRSSTPGMIVASGRGTTGGSHSRGPTTMRPGTPSRSGPGGGWSSPGPSD